MTARASNREFVQPIPAAPRDDAGIMTWAKQLVAALQLRDLKESYKVTTPELGSTLVFSPSLGNICSISADRDITILANAKKVGPMWFVIANDSTPRTITFGTGFRSAGALVGTANKAAVLGFISEGNSFFEVSRLTNL